ncbi:MAG: hypothetical protein IKT19_01045 [Paludibacteraceae bacterium]|nr:hypothetical protein [Paludibacteraceae bacterium]
MMQAVMHIAEDENLKRVGHFGILPIEACELESGHTILTESREGILDYISCPDGFRRIAKPRIPTNGTEHYATRQNDD